MNDKSNIAGLLLGKFVNEEIMTKSELQLAIDKIMDKHEASIDNKFRIFEERIDRQFLKIDSRYNWIIGLIITATITLGAGLGGILLKIMTMLPTITH
ncbi:MAG: hypothetical protein K0R14_1164 [Burkholderiales bacterium]|jgi:hypothetical protein|nr:hypothetical protein [Burkholderiales bacterium]